MYVEVFKQTFSQSKVDPSAVKKICSVGLGGIQENLYVRENFELSGNSFGLRLTKATQYFDSVRQFFIKKMLQK